MTGLKVLASLACVLAGAWGAFALYYQGPASPALRIACMVAWGLLAAAAAIGLWKYPPQTLLFYAAAFLLLFVWWRGVAPSDDRDWADEVAHLASGTVDGSRVSLSHVRHFDWRTTTDYDVRWQARTYDLDRLQSVDLILSYWGRPDIAHTLVSFGFDDGAYVVFSVEIRKERHEAFSEIGGFFRQFELSVIAADERDIVRLRTNVRGEDCYLYRIGLTREARQALFLAYVEEANRLARQPRFYNSLTANCTTIVYGMTARIVDGLPLDYRLILSGRLPDYIHRLGGLAEGHTAAELREGGRITQRARDADRDPDFSHRIRQGVPGIGTP